MNNEEWEKLRRKAKQMADKQYAAEASSIVHLTRDEITEVLDEAAVDKETLSELIAIIGDSMKSNQQKAHAIRNVNGLAEVAASLISKLL
ncbi:MAG TPA: hypothetical protein DCZ12_09700 [Gammaproteobacteria bacterium]|nr:hypothetical protein [Gammaproteobacteria bacterium]